MNLNERIKNLFLNMINCPEKIVSVQHNKIEFNNGIAIKYWNKARNEKDVNNEPLELKSQNFSIDCIWNVINIDITDHLIFTIDTPYRQYYVPDFTDRLEYANVLNTIDKDIALFEERKLTEYELHFVNGSNLNIEEPF